MRPEWVNALFGDGAAGQCYGLLRGLVENAQWAAKAIAEAAVSVDLAAARVREYYEAKRRAEVQR